MEPNLTGSQEIKCNVHSCRYHDKAAHCTLHDIVVGNDNMAMEAKTKKETECASFISEI